MECNAYFCSSPREFVERQKALISVGVRWSDDTQDIVRGRAYYYWIVERGSVMSYLTVRPNQVKNRRHYLANFIRNRFGAGVKPIIHDTEPVALIDKVFLL